MKTKNFKSKVISWKQGKGYGFVANPDGGPDLFLHINDIRKKRVPVCGNRVRFQLRPGKEGVQTIEHARLLRYDVRFALNWVFAALICIIPFGLSFHVLLHNPLPLILYSCMSAACFLLIRSDKKRAEQGLWRIPDNSLHLTQLLWGWPGSLIAQKIYLHKSQKKSFQGVLHFILFIHYVFWIDALFMDHLILNSSILFLQRLAIV